MRRDFDVDLVAFLNSDVTDQLRQQYMQEVMTLLRDRGAEVG